MMNASRESVKANATRATPARREPTRHGQAESRAASGGAARAGPGSGFADAAPARGARSDQLRSPAKRARRGSKHSAASSSTR